MQNDITGRKSYNLKSERMNKPEHYMSTYSVECFTTSCTQSCSRINTKLLFVQRKWRRKNYRFALLWRTVGDKKCRFYGFDAIAGGWTP